MKKLFIFSLVIATGLFSIPKILFSQEEVESLRGDFLIEDDSLTPSWKRALQDQAPFARAYVQQPPLIPHSIENYKINHKHNKCLTCHSWSNYREKNATKISQSHFVNRDDQELANVAPRRYFCNQCHVPQADAQPLIDNTFEPVDILQ